MTKQDLVRAVAQKVGYTHEAASLTIDALVEAVLEAVRSGEQVTLNGLVRIKIVDTKPKPARLGRNLRTGETITIPPKPAGKKVKVVAMTALKDAVP